MYPHERSLVKRLQDKPFVLLGVNSDKDLVQLKVDMEKEQITWRSFYDGGSPNGNTSGPIATRWNVSGWPTLYFIDAKGVIRHKSLGSPGDETVDKWIDQLVEEATKSQ